MDSVQHCSVHIVTRADGARQELRAQGTLHGDGEQFTVHYRDAGDLVTLCSQTHCFFMQRQGEVNLSCNFPATGAAQMKVLAEGREGTLPISVSRYKRTALEGGYLVRLDYTLGEGAHSKRFRLEISVRINSEEK